MQNFLFYDSVTNLLLQWVATMFSCGEKSFHKYIVCVTNNDFLMYVFIHKLQFHSDSNLN
jgi:hypothetical protein